MLRNKLINITECAERVVPEHHTSPGFQVKDTHYVLYKGKASTTYPKKNNQLIHIKE